MKRNSLIFLALIFLLGCESDRHWKKHCVTGKIVGQKCDVYALQLNLPILGAQKWTKENQATGEIEGTYDNVIGLRNLPEEFQNEGTVLFVTLRIRTPTDEPLDCYTDMPGPPAPMYEVEAASTETCLEVQMF